MSETGKLLVSALRKYYITCNNCGVRDKDFFVSIEEAREEFCLGGWVKIRGLWECGECQENTHDDR